MERSFQPFKQQLSECSRSLFNSLIFPRQLKLSGNHLEVVGPLARTHVLMAFPGFMVTEFFSLVPPSQPSHPPRSCLKSLRNLLIQILKISQGFLPFHAARSAAVPQPTDSNIGEFGEGSLFHLRPAPLPLFPSNPPRTTPSLLPLIINLAQCAGALLQLENMHVSCHCRAKKQNLHVACHAIAKQAIFFFFFFVFSFLS